MSDIIGWLGSAWQGKARLAHVFWFGMLGIFCIELLIVMLFGVSQEMSLRHFLFSSIMSVWWWVSVWRCAPNSDAQVWLWLSRGLIVLQMLSWLSMAAYFLGGPPVVVTYEGYETIP